MQLSFFAYLTPSSFLKAPDVQLVNGVYHVYYSVSTFGSQNSAIGLATSPTMEAGSWTDKGATGIVSSSSKAYNAIDANLINADGTYYMNFGSFWNDIYQAPMNSAATKVSASSYNIAYQPSGSHAVEGAYMYKYGSYYYLFFSVGTCCGYDTSRPASGDEYKIKVCRSTSPTSGFVSSSPRPGKMAVIANANRSIPLALRARMGVAPPSWKATAPSMDPVDSMSLNIFPFLCFETRLTRHRGVFTDPTYGPVLYYHYVDTTIGYGDGQKLFGWNKIDFSSGWPVV